MNSHLSQNGIKLFQFKSLRSILPVFCGNITGCARHTTLFMFGTFKNDLNSISFYFLCHNILSHSLLSYYFNTGPIAITSGNSIFQSRIQSLFVNGAQTGCANAERNPAILLHIKELFCEKIYIERSLGPSLRMGNVIAYHSFFSGNLTNSRHFYLII